MSFLIYGAYGYTGELTTRFAVERGMKPIVAGRNEAKTKALAERFGLSYRVFDLSEDEKLQAALKEVKVVLHCAGPFVHTCNQMAEACMKTGTHYLDITGELQVFEWLKRKDQAAKDAKVMLMPGVGFDVVPSDCLSAWLKDRMPDATQLHLALRNSGSLSHGTATTVVENLGEGGMIRENGKLKRVPDAYDSRVIDFGEERPLSTMTIPWGDVSTAYHSTSIPNIRVYMTAHPKTISQMKWTKYLGWLLRSSLVKNYLKKKIDARPAGPSDEQREKGYSKIWGEVKNAAGETKSSIFSGPEGYTLTALTSLRVIEHVLNGNVKIGYQTPSSGYGKKLVLEVEGTQIEDLS